MSGRYPDSASLDSSPMVCHIRSPDDVCGPGYLGGFGFERSLVCEKSSPRSMLVSPWFLGSHDSGPSQTHHVFSRTIQTYFLIFFFLHVGSVASLFLELVVPTQTKPERNGWDAQKSLG